MCWNWQISLATWLVVVVSSLYLFKRRRPYDVTFGLLLLFYGSMQFWEFLMWLDQNCGALNKAATIGAYYALYSHAFAIGLGLYLEIGDPWPMAVGLGLLAAGVYFMPRSFGCSVPAQSCGHLKWGFDDRFYMVVFLVCMIVPPLYIKPLTKGLSFSVIFILSYIFSRVFVDRGGIASFWCFIAAAAGPLFILANA